MVMNLVMPAITAHPLPTLDRKMPIRIWLEMPVTMIMIEIGKFTDVQNVRKKIIKKSIGLIRSDFLLFFMYNYNI